MVDMNKILKSIKKSFSQRKIVDFEEAQLRFELEPLNSYDEIKILEACKDIDGTQYIEALKRHSLACSVKKINNMDLTEESVEYEDKDGNKKEKSKYLFMVDYLAEWPSALVDELFNAFTDMQNELEARVKKEAKFEKFTLSEEPEEDKADQFRRIQEPDNAPGMTETERLDKKVKDEINRENDKIAETESEALSHK